MGMYKLTGKYETLIDGLSNKLSAEAGKRVSKTEALQRILDIVIEEEKLFSTKEQPVSFFRRSIFRVQEKARTSKTVYELIDSIISAISH